MKKNVEDFRDFNKEHLGRPKNLGQTAVLNDPTMVFGVSKQGDDWDVAKCLRGEDTFDDAYNDPTLGRTTRFGFRNQTLPGDDNRVFGTPSIRDDFSRPKLVSVSNTNVNIKCKLRTSEMNQQPWK